MGNQEDAHPTASRIIRLAATVLAGLTLLAFLDYLATARHTFLLFHSLAEAFGIMVAMGAFMVAWNTRRLEVNQYVACMGLSMLPVAAILLLHMLAYQGMGVFTAGGEPDLATQLWVAAKYLQAAAMLVAPLMIGRKVHAQWLGGAFALAAALLLASIFWWGVFPTCYGQSITHFKVVSEYAIMATMLAAAGLLWTRRQAFEPEVLWLLIGSALLATAAEGFFANYSQVTGSVNAAGHLLSIGSYYLLYKAIIQTGLAKPFNLLFRDLRRSKDALEESRRRYRNLAQELELRVVERTAELRRAMEELQVQAKVRRDLEDARLKLAEIVESSDDAIISQTPDGLVLSWNRGAENIYGYTAWEMVGRSIMTLVPADRRQEMQDIMGRVAAGERFESVEMLCLRKDGHIIPVTMTHSPIRDTANSISSIAITARDMSEHRRLEAEILMASEGEQQRIGHDLHDTLGQHLTGTAFLCKVLQRKLIDGKSPQAAEAAGIEHLVNEAVALTRSLARGLSPIGLKEDNLINSLRQLCGNVQDMFGVSCKLNAPQKMRLLDMAMATNLYRIAQEAINNALRHGKARNIEVNLVRNEGSLLLAVQDDGVGLPKGAPHKGGMGLKIMNYRANTIGGSLHVQSPRTGGTHVTCIVRHASLASLQDDA